MIFGSRFYVTKLQSENTTVMLYYSFTTMCLVLLTVATIF